MKTHFDSVKINGMAAECGSCCSQHAHHEDCGCGHHHAHDHSGSVMIRPLLSFCMLVAGMVMKQAGIVWFQNGIVPVLWYLFSFLPVGWPVIKEAVEAIRNRDCFNEFTLMVLAAVGAFCIGEYPEAVAVMLFYTIGETFQHRAVDRARRHISSLLDVRPEQASVWRNGQYVVVSPKEISAGEQIELKPGERVPLDGYLVEEQALFDTSALTGESMPRTVGRDGEVLSGTIVIGQTVHLKVSRPYEQSALSRILKLVEDASERKAPAELFIRRFARIYTPVVMVLAALITAVPALVALLVPAFTYVFSDWLYRGLVFLVISCPCALVISVPLGYFAGIGAASRLGILFKGGNYLDAITRINAVAFDKTGTLTTGRFEVKKIFCNGFREEELLSLIVTLEQGSTHPLARTVVNYAQERKISPLTEVAVKEISGQGVEAVIEGRRVLVGNNRLMEHNHVKLPVSWDEEGGTVIACAVDEALAGGLVLADSLKEDAVQTIADLKAMGIDDLTLLSGDRTAIVEKYASDLHIEKAYGDLLPEDKAEYVEQISVRPDKSVAFVGDGMNDAPVLALSDIGIAMGGLGSDAAIESADLVIQNDQPSKIVTAIRIGRYTRRIVRQNIIGAISVKVIVLLAGAAGFASLWGAVFADVGVALLAVLNSMRIFAKKME